MKKLATIRDTADAKLDLLLDDEDATMPVAVLRKWTYRRGTPHTKDIRILGEEIALLKKALSEHFPEHV